MLIIFPHSTLGDLSGKASPLHHLKPSPQHTAPNSFSELQPKRQAPFRKPGIDNSLPMRPSIQFPDPISMPYISRSRFRPPPDGHR